MDFEKYQIELEKGNLTSFDDLEKLVTPFVKKATEIKVLPPSILQLT